MKTWICNTLTNFWGPMQGSARLNAYLKGKGYDVTIKDFNQNAYFALLSEDYLRATIDKTINLLDPSLRSKFFKEDIGSIIENNSNGAINRLIAQGILRSDKRFDLLKGNALLRPALLKLIDSRINKGNLFFALLGESEYAIKEIERSRALLDKQWYGLPAEEFIKNFQVLLCGKAIIDAAYFPAQIDFGFGFHGGAYSPRGRDVLAAVKDERFNFLLPYFRNEVMPLLEKERPDIVGISITHTAELIPAFTLANMIKSKRPDIHICLGGATTTEIAHRLQKNTPLWGMFDSIVLGPGESSFGDLIEALEGKKGLSNVPNLIYKDGESVKKSDKMVEFDINDAVTPDFGPLRPKSGLPLEASSGCYWGKCIFCYYPKMGTSGLNPESNDKRFRRIELVFEDIQKLNKAYAPVYIGFTDSSFSPARLEKLADLNLAAHRVMPFSAFIRFECEFKSLQFCKKLSAGGFLGGQIGLESGCQRTNDTINKGVDLKDAETIIRNFHDCGILVHLYSLVGAPGESKADAAMTRDFIKKWHKYLGLDWTIFTLFVLEHGPLVERAGEFGLRVKPLPEDFLVQVAEYELENGFSQEEAVGCATRFYEELKNYMHPLRHLMDIESYKVFILKNKAAGTGPARLRAIVRRLISR